MGDTEFTSTTHYQALHEHKLVGSRCKSCGKLFAPARPMCPECHGKEMEAVELSGKGKLTAFSVIYIGTSAMIRAGFDRKKPYCTGIVQLDEGPCVSAQIIGADVSQPENIKIGAPATIAFLDRVEGENTKTYLGFQI